MNHRNGVKKLGKDRAHRLAMLRSLAHSLFTHEKIKTTKLKAKMLRGFVEKIITQAKVDNLHNRRLVYRDIKNTQLIKKIFENIGKRFQNRNGGYTRIYNIGPRKGDGAEVCYIELVEELLTPPAATTKETKSELPEATSTIAVANGETKKTEKSSAAETPPGGKAAKTTGEGAEMPPPAEVPASPADEADDKKKS